MFDAEYNDLFLSRHYPLKPCPFALGLRKFALDPTIVIFFKKCKKSVG